MWRKWDASAPAAQLLLCQGNLWRPSQELRRAVQGMYREELGCGVGGVVERGTKSESHAVTITEWAKNQQKSSGVGERKGGLRATVLWRGPTDGWHCSG